MSVFDRIRETENIKPGSSGGSSFNPLIYPSLILKEGTPEKPDPSLIAFLVDWNRSLQLDLHFNEKARKMDLCNKLNGKPCQVCADGEAWNKANKSKSKEARGMNPHGKTTVRLFPVWDFKAVGNKVLNDDGSLKYEEEPIKIYGQRPGEGMENYVILKDANGEDPFYYYDDMGPDAEPRFDLQPDRLVDCELMTENGSDRLWSVAKIRTGGVAPKGKVSYKSPTSVTAKQAKSILGSEAKLQVPKFVRDHFDQQSLLDLLPFYLAPYGNVDTEAWELEPIQEGQKLQTVAPKEKAESVL